MKLAEFRQLSDAEVCKRVNAQFALPDYHKKEVMEEQGYDFSWTSMEKEAKKRGLARMYAPRNGEALEGNVEPIMIELVGKEVGERRTFTAEKRDWQRLDDLTKKLRRTSDKSAIFSKVLQIGLDAIEAAAKMDRVKLVRPAPELDIES